MARSTLFSTIGLKHDSSEAVPSRTPGPLGMNDAASPSVKAYLGDTPGPCGRNDGSDPNLYIADSGSKKGRVISPICNTPRVSPPLNDEQKAISNTPQAALSLSDEQKAINVKAFLKLLRYAEHKPREDNGVYYLLYGGKETFTDTNTHPNRKIEAWGRTSTAAGAYQILKPTWDDAKKRGIVADFSPASQDKLALWKLEQRGALPDVEAGKIEKAILLLRNEWASLPGASQSGMKMSDAQSHFEKYVQEYSKQ